MVDLYTVRVARVVLFKKNFDEGSVDRSVLELFAAVGGAAWAVIGAGRTAKRMSGKPVPSPERAWGSFELLA